MSLLKEIQDAAIDSTTDLGSLLRRCKVLAARLDSKPLENWLIWESNGYPQDAELPSYRMWPLSFVGHFSGPFGSGLRNALISPRHIPEKVRDSYATHKCRLSISALEQLGKTEDGQLIVRFNDLAALLGTNVYVDMNCMVAWGTFGTSHIHEALNSVRNRILDFALAIGKEFPQVDEEGPPGKIEPARVLQIFNTKVMGDMTGVVGAVSESTVQFQIAKADWDGLANYLRGEGVTGPDLAQLRRAIDKDPPPKELGRPGPKVSGWMGKMVGKAASGAWKVGMDAATSVLAKAIAAYYGLPSP